MSWLCLWFWFRTWLWPVFWWRWRFHTYIIIQCLFHDGIFIIISAFLWNYILLYLIVFSWINRSPNLLLHMSINHLKWVWDHENVLSREFFELELSKPNNLELFELIWLIMILVCSFLRCSSKLKSDNWVATIWKENSTLLWDNRFELTCIRFWSLHRSQFYAGQKGAINSTLRWI